MFTLLKVAAVILVAIAMGLALAHALELPGKLRLPRETYKSVQPIYYPGFTIGGALGEGGGMVALLLLILVTPPATAPFWLAVGAFLALAGMHAIYWLLTHPVNNFWLTNAQLSPAAASFFRARASDSDDADADWTVLRDQWEYSHVIRAALGLVSLTLLMELATVDA